jgi:hypothetical protein
MNEASSVNDLVAEYEAKALLWSELQGHAKAANVVFDRLQVLQKLLRPSMEGRAGITDLVSSGDTGVRLMAATHVLAFDPDAGVAALEAIEAGPGLHAVSAKYTLRSFRAGTLDLDC